MNEYLNKLYELYFMATQTHWNYSGANFDAIHLYASEVAALSLVAIDDVVELCKARGINTTIKIEQQTFYNVNNKKLAQEFHTKLTEVYRHIDMVSQTSEQFGYADMTNALGNQSEQFGKYVYKLTQTLE